MDIRSELRKRRGCLEVLREALVAAIREESKDSVLDLIDECFNNGQTGVPTEKKSSTKRNNDKGRNDVYDAVCKLAPVRTRALVRYLYPGKGAMKHEGSVSGHLFRLKKDGLIAGGGLEGWSSKVERTAP